MAQIAENLKKSFSNLIESVKSWSNISSSQANENDEKEYVEAQNTESSTMQLRARGPTTPTGASINLAIKQMAEIAKYLKKKVLRLVNSVKSYGSSNTAAKDENDGEPNLKGEVLIQTRAVTVRAKGPTAPGKPRAPPASVLDSGSIPALFDESQIFKLMPLQNKSEEIIQCLNGRCIYLVGMMGSGKTIVGKVLSEALGYSFHDCDTLIEQVVGGTTVAEIFKLHGESFFRDNETEVLHKLSLMHRLVVSTDGGAVVRPTNWRHMQKGISVWLDVPVEALARRITAVGTGSRPLLHHDYGDPYSKVS
ncbi:hypothetical protein RD792_008624 [Penstemon davidsonii]|uniref:Shikimate kinase n=1 Tax=Penstemon davidsonii TaxID=160366 RepID=A0ABR0D9M2_9LAMI|nr:hypothetical protein RD792_008624 [Penstemon davidsonii]